MNLLPEKIFVHLKIEESSKQNFHGNNIKYIHRNNEILVYTDFLSRSPQLHLRGVGGVELIAIDASDF